MEQPKAHLGIPRNIFTVEFTPQTVWSGDNWPDVEDWDRIPQYDADKKERPDDAWWAWICAENGEEY